MALELIVGIASLSFILIYLATTLDNEHSLIKGFLYLFSVTMLILIPASLVTYDQGVILHKLFLGFYVILWIYLIMQFFYSVMKKFGIIISKRGRRK